MDAKILRDFVAKLLVGHGALQDYASVTAEVLVEGDLRGHGSHGVSRLKRIITGVKHNTIDLKARAEVEKENAATALVNGNASLGHPVAKQAMELAIKKAREFGIGAVGVHNTTHFGMAGYYSELATLQGMIGITTCNTEPGMPPFGGLGKILGTNPIAIAYPYKPGKPVMIDMATSAIARGKAFEALRKGEQLPVDVALDKEGKPTQDPEKALEGFLLPIGGAVAYKGFGLAMAFDVLSGALVRGSCGPDVRGSATTTEKCTVGNFMIAIDIESFTSAQEFRTKVSKLVESVKSSGENVYYPGEKEQLLREERMKKGVPLDEALIEKLRALGGEVGVKLD